VFSPVIVVAVFAVANMIVLEATLSFLGLGVEPSVVTWGRMLNGGRLYLNTAHPDHPGLYFAGLIQANGSIWRLAALQGKIIASAIIAEHAAPAEAAEFRMRARAAADMVPSGTFLASDRHKLEVNYFDYARTLKRVARLFKVGGKAAFAAARSETRQPEDLRQAAE